MYFAVSSDKLEASGRNRAPQMSEWVSHCDLRPHPVRRQLSYQRSNSHWEEEEDRLEKDVGAAVRLWGSSEASKSKKFNSDDEFICIYLPVTQITCLLMCLVNKM